MPADAIDNQVWSLLVSTLQAIVAGATYLTSPVVEEGIPPDPIPSVALRPRVYVNHLRTDPADPEIAGPVHRWRSRFDVWIAAKDVRTTNQVRADVLRALYSAEGPFTTLAQQPMYPLETTRRDEPSKSGIALALLSTFIDYQTDHVAT